MKITYRREMKHNYMIIDPEALVWRNYQCRMLTANSIEGVLHFQIRQVDDEIRFYYEITSRQPLDRMLESRSVHTEELRSLVFGISRVLDRMEQYLLPEGNVLLTPDYIYVEPETFRIWLCLVPGLERNFPEDYGKLLEYLLGKVDHQDKESVVLAYGLYQETRRENYGMEDILRLFRCQQEASYRAEEDEAEQEDEEDPGVQFRETAGQGTAYAEERQGRRKSRGGSARNAGYQEGISGSIGNAGGGKTLGKCRERDKKGIEGGSREKGQKKQKKEKAGLWGWLKGWWDRRRSGKETEAVQVPWEMMFHEEDVKDQRTYPAVGTCQTATEDSFSRQTNRISQSCEYGTEVRMEAPEWQERTGRAEMPGAGQLIQPGQDTVLLADLTPDTRTKLRRLRALDENGEDIVISYYPFIIGKQENLVDFLLPYDTVSRLHLRIDRDDNRYFVQDLNSTNGTTVQGRLLDNNESVELQEGDEIHIARYRYRFE